MVFSSAVFLFLFLPLLLGLYRVLPRSLQNSVLLLGSLLFYAWGEGAFCLLMLTSIGLNYAFGRLVDRARDVRHRKAIVALAVVVNLAFLGWYKYANFIADTLSALGLGALGLSFELSPIHLPIGISFFTFQALSYVVDVYRGEGRARKNPLDVALYISLFPQLIAGPIVRFRDIADQLRDRSVALADFAYGIRRFVIGLGKKVLIANTVAIPADQIFELPASELTFALAWVGLIAYTFQIYFDFSGYSDMAIGLGRMFGFRFLENFNYPYISRSVTEFWRRWHISLSSWFRDYVYIPLGGNRGGRIKTYRNLLLVFFVTGLWHGASFSFIVWGFYHGFFLILERMMRGRGFALPAVVRHAYVLLVVMVGWVFFRANTLGFALDYLKALVGLGAGIGYLNYAEQYLNPEMFAAFAAAAIGCTPFMAQLFGSVPGRLRGLSRPVRPVGEVIYSLGSLAYLTSIMLACAAILAAQTHNPFIYFRF